jgi:hypothetical protein
MTFLFGIYRMKRVAIDIGDPRFHFDKDSGFIMDRYYIYLPVRGPVIGIN